MKIGDLIQFTEDDETHIGLVIDIRENYSLMSIKVRWCFNEEDRLYYDETSWMCEDEVKLISKRT
jgi:hypothetical protein